MRRKLRLWREFSTNHDQLIEIMSSLFCLHYTQITPKTTKTMATILGQKNKFQVKNFINHSELFWAIDIKSWIFELFQRILLLMNLLYFTYSTLCLELVLYWLFLFFWFIKSWQFVNSFWRISISFIISNENNQNRSKILTKKHSE